MRETKGRACPRKCGGRLMTGEQSKYNARSKRDGKQICSDCFIDECIEDSYVK